MGRLKMVVNRMVIICWLQRRTNRTTARLYIYGSDGCYAGNEGIEKVKGKKRYKKTRGRGREGMDGEGPFGRRKRPLKGRAVDES